MHEKTYQILYCSRNNIAGSPEEVHAEVERVLRSSRKNNASDGVTGALFFNTVFFAQVLEGSFEQVQRVFERLQLDPRHSDLVVLQSGYVANRDFSDWSMAYAGTPADTPLPFPSFEGSGGAVPDSSLSGEKVLTFLHGIVVKQDVLALPERPSRFRPSMAEAVLAGEASRP